MPDRITRKSSKAPDFGPVVQALRRTGVGYLLLGITILFLGGGLLVYAIFIGKGDDFSQISKIAGGLIAVTSLQVFNSSRKRFERIGVLETLRLHWIDVAERKGSESQIAELNKLVVKLFRDNLSAAI